MSVISNLYDQHVGIFSPDGRLYQVEYAFQAVAAANITAAAVKGPESVAFAVEKGIQDELIFEGETTCIHNLTPQIGAVIIGRQADARAEVRDVVVEASNFKYKNGFEISTDRLAVRLAGLHQQLTQATYERIRGIVVMLASFDEEIGPSLISVDPAGNYIIHKATGVGAKKHAVNLVLEKKLREMPEPPGETTVQIALKALQSALDKKLTAEGVEVLLCTKQSRAGRRLTGEEISAHLNAIDAEVAPGTRMEH